MDSSSQISDLIFSNKTVQSTLKALIQLFTLHLCVLGKWGQKEDLLGLAVGGQCNHWACEREVWEDSVPAHFGHLSVSGCLVLPPTSVNCSGGLFLSAFFPFKGKFPKESAELSSPFCMLGQVGAPGLGLSYKVLRHLLVICLPLHK